MGIKVCRRSICILYLFIYVHEFFAKQPHIQIDTSNNLQRSYTNTHTHTQICLHFHNIFCAIRVFVYFNIFHLRKIYENLSKCSKNNLTVDALFIFIAQIAYNCVCRPFFNNGVQCFLASLFILYSAGIRS